MSSDPAPKKIVSGMWQSPAEIAENNFQYKSLSNFAFNTAVGCLHGCGFCYVPDVSTGKLCHFLRPLGVTDPDREWGEYVLVRPWDEAHFMRSLAKAERTPPDKLNPTGNRAVIISSTTDPYQVIRSSDPAQTEILNEQHRTCVRHGLMAIRDHSKLNVRVLTRSPLAERDFELFLSFGARLTFGMSIPTLNDKLARVYEPHAPSVQRRLKTLENAKKAGLHIFVAIAPTYPECDEADLRATLEAVAPFEPITIFHEPINIRAQNVARIRAEADRVGPAVNTDALAAGPKWRAYALEQLKLVERLAADVGVGDRLHLWPDSSLGTKAACAEQKDPAAHKAWLNHWWQRTSEWPHTTSTAGQAVENVYQICDNFKCHSPADTDEDAANAIEAAIPAFLRRRNFERNYETFSAVDGILRQARTSITTIHPAFLVTGLALEPIINDELYKHSKPPFRSLELYLASLDPEGERKLSRKDAYAFVAAARRWIDLKKRGVTPPCRVDHYRLLNRLGSLEQVECVLANIKARGERVTTRSIVAEISRLQSLSANPGHKSQNDELLTPGRAEAGTSPDGELLDRGSPSNRNGALAESANADAGGNGAIHETRLASQIPQSQLDDEKKAQRILSKVLGAVELKYVACDRIGHVFAHLILESDELPETFSEAARAYLAEMGELEGSGE